MFELYKSQLEECINNTDLICGYMDANEVLINIALNCHLLLNEREILIDLYNKIEKIYP